MAKTALLIPIEGPVTEITVDGLADLQAAVEGLIEPIGLTGGEMYINEEGKCLNMEANARATTLALLFGGLMPNDIVVGPAIVLGLLDADGNDTSINEAMRDVVALVDLAWRQAVEA